MVPNPPGFAKILNGLLYGMRVAFAQVKAGEEADHPQNVSAVWDALWASWLISLMIGVPMLGLWGSLEQLLSFIIVSLLITMLYPVLSYYVLAWLGFQHRYVPFIITMTWINNFREVLVLLLVLAFNSIQRNDLLMILTPVAFWMLWAFWRGGTQALRASGWTGLLMLALLITVHLMPYMLMTISQANVATS
jgi:hypothetical protein